MHGEPITLLTLTTERRVYLVLESWNRVPALREIGARRALMDDINKAVGTSMRLTRTWQSFPAELIYDDQRRSRFFDVMGRLVDALRKSPPPTASADQIEPTPTLGEPSELNQRYQRFFREVVDRWVNLDPAAVAPVVGARNWLTVGAGRSGFAFAWSIASGRGLRTELYIDVGDKSENKRYFDLLRADAQNLEAALGERLAWDRLDDRQASRISLVREADMRSFDRDPALAEWAAEAMVKMDRVFRPKLQHLR